MHGRPAQLLVGRLLARRHLDQGRAAEEDLGPLLDHNDVVAHARHVRPAGGGVAEHQRHRGQRRRRVAGEVPEGPAAGDEELGLGGQVGTARLDQVDHGQAVLQGDVRGTGALAERVGVHRSAPHRGVVGADEALDPFDHADPDDRRGPHLVLGAPGGQRAQLEEGRVPVDQQLDALVGQQLAPLPVSLHVPFASSGPGRRQLLVDVGHRLGQGAPVGPVGLRAGVDGGGEDGHGALDGCGDGRRCRGRCRGRVALGPPTWEE